MQRQQKVKRRRKLLRWRASWLLVKIPWFVTFMGLVGMGFWAKETLGRPCFLHLKGFVVTFDPISEEKFLPTAALDSLKASLAKNNRLYCLLDSREHFTTFMGKYSFIRSIKLDYYFVVFHGEARLKIRFREPVALFEYGNRLLCLDKGGESFLCPDPLPQETLVRVSHLKGPLFKGVFKSAKKLESCLDEKIVEIDNISDTVVAFKSSQQRTYRFNKSNALRPRLFAQNLEQLIAVQKDLLSRSENFSYIDLTLSEVGRVIVGTGDRI